MERFWSRSQQGLLEFSPNFRAMGSAFWVAWITIVYSEKVVLASPEIARVITSDAFIASTFALAIALLAMGCFPKGVRRIVDRPPAMMALMFAAAAATVAIGLGASLPSWVAVAAPIVTGTLTGFLVIRIGVVYSEMDTRDAVMALCSSLMLGALIFSFATMLSSQLPLAPLAIAAAMLPLSVVVLYAGPRDAVEYQHRPAAAMPEGFGRMFTAVFLLSFALCCIRGYYPGSLDSGGFAATLGLVALFLIAGSGVLATAAAALPRNAPFGTYTYWLLLGDVCAALVLPMFGMGSPVAGVVGSVLFGMALLLVFALLSRIAYRSGASVVRAFGWGFGAAGLGTTLGFVVGYLIVGSGLESEGLLLDVMILAACVVVAVFLLRRKDLEQLMEPVEVDAEFDGDARTELQERPDVRHDRLQDIPQAGSVAPSAIVVGEGTVSADEAEGGVRAPFRFRCEMLAEEHGLSSRERDVFMLMARGRDARLIAEELFVSYNTARTHIRNVYSKMGVHSRRELMELVDKREGELPVLTAN